MKNNLKKSAKSTIDKVTQILSEEADIKINENIHKTYVTFHVKIDVEKYSGDEITKESRKLLFDRNTPSEVKKKLLFLLGHFATKECFDILRKYINKQDIRLKEWAILALKDLQLKVEGQVYEKDYDLIMSPMGGKGNKFRYFVVIGSRHNKLLTGINQKTVKKDLLTIASKTNSQVEEIQFGKIYIFFTILISFDIAVGKVINDFLDIISKQKNILKYHYFVINTHKITKKEIDEYLKMGEVQKL